MNWRDIFHISLRILRTNILRTMLTMLGIATAIGLIMVLIGFGYGVRAITIGSIVRSQSLLSLQVRPGVDENATPLNQEVIDSFAKLDGVKEITPEFISEGQVGFHDVLVSNTFSAGNTSLLSMEGVKIPSGRAFTDGALEIVISPQTLELLDMQASDILNQKITFSYVNTSAQQEVVTIDQPLTVVGITDGNASANMYLSYDLVKETPGIKLGQVRLLADSRDSIVGLESAITNRGYEVETLLKTLDDARKVFRWITLGLGVIAAIALVVSAIGMFNTMTIALLERTREIGIMKSIGIMDHDILRLFLADALIIGFVGGVVGIISGLLIGEVINTIVNHLANKNGGNSLDLFIYPAWFLVAIFLFPVILGIVTGLYPAIRAARLNPLRALRYE